MANAKPVAEVRIGAIKAAIWKNEAGASTRHNVTFQRIYKDGDDGWKTSQSFGRDDLLVLAKVADLDYAVTVTPADAAVRLPPALTAVLC